VEDLRDHGEALSRRASPEDKSKTPRISNLRDENATKEKRMSLTDDQRKFYENTLKVTKKEISDLEANIQEELAKVKERLAELQNAQKAARQMYAAACMRLGIQNDLEEAEES
jgi:hypothetical protein